MLDQGNGASRAEGDLRSFGFVLLLIGAVLWVFNLGMHSAGMGIASGICLVVGVVLVIAWLIVRAAKR